MFEVAIFRKVRPEFQSDEKYPPEQIQLYAGIACKLIRECVWCDQTDYAVGLYVAHHLAITARNVRASKVKGGIPGAVQGPLTAKSVDKVASSYDATSVTFENAGFWNMTVYGVELYQLALMFGAGAFQVM